MFWQLEKDSAAKDNHRYLMWRNKIDISIRILVFGSCLNILATGKTLDIKIMGDEGLYEHADQKLGIQ